MSAASSSPSSNDPPSVSGSEEGSPSEEGSSESIRVSFNEEFNEETPFFPETVRPEKAPDNDRPTEARRPDARTGSFDRRMFCATFVKFVVPRNEMVCRFRAWSVAMNRRCFTETMSSTTTSSAVSAKNASISDAGALFSDAMRANRSSSSNVDTTGNGGCVAARVFACSMFVAPRSFVAAVATTSAMASKPSARGLNDAPPSDLTVGGVGGVGASSTTDESSSAAFFTGRETSLSIPSRV